MAENNNLIPTEPDWDGTPMSRSEEILYSIIHTEEWDGTPMSRGEYFLVQLKDAVENLSMMDIKGTVPTVADLPATGNKKGDVYSVGPEEQLNKPEYYWDGTSWQYLGQIVDLSGYLPLTGGTMTGNLDFSIGGKTISIGVSNNETQIISTNADGPLIIASKDMLLQSRSGCIELQVGASQPAISINRNGQSETKIYGNSSAEIGSSWETTVNSDRKTTIKGHRSNNTDTNTITLDSNGITETTLAKKVVTTATGIELGTTSVDNTVSVSTPLKKLSVTSPVQMDVNSGGNLNVTGYGNVNVTATAGEVKLVGTKGYVDVIPNGVVRVASEDGLELMNTTQNATTTTIKTNGQGLSLRTTGSSGIEVGAAGSAAMLAQHGSATVASVESGVTIGGASGVTVNGNKGGVSLLASTVDNTTGYVTVGHGAAVPASDSTNKVATTAMAHNIANSKIGTVPFGTCSSAANAVAKTVTVTNFPGLVDGATIMVLFENTNTATNPTLNVNESGAQPIMSSAASAVSPYVSGSWIGNHIITLVYVQNIGWTMSDYTQFPWVNQFNNASNNDYSVLLSSEAVDRNTVASTNKSGNLTFNPSSKKLIATDGKLYMKSTNIAIGTNPQSTTVSNGQILYTDNDGTELFGIYHQTFTTGTKQVIFEVFNTDSGGNDASNRFALTISRDGVSTYTIKDPANFCDAIGLGSVLQDISNIQSTIGDINTVLEEVL